MSFLSGGGRWVGGNRGMDTRVVGAEIEQRRAVRSDRLGIGTLACARCDAPVAIGGTPHALTDRLTCPFCAHSGTLRDFLSMASPSRPARVVVRVSRPAASS